MALEKSWAAVPPRSLTSNGTQYGVVNVSSTAGFKVKQRVVLHANTLPDLTVQVKRVNSRTQLIVGPIETVQGKQQLTARTDISAYTVALGAYIYAEEQPKNVLKPEDIIQAVYRQEPGTTIGVEINDEFGNPIASVVDEEGRNRLAVDAEVTVTGISVDLDAMTPPTRPDPDNVLIVGSEDGTKEGTKHAARVDSELDLRVGISDGNNKAVVNPDGSLNTNTSVSDRQLWDNITLGYNAIQDVETASFTKDGNTVNYELIYDAFGNLTDFTKIP